MLLRSGRLRGVKSGPRATDPWWIPEAGVDEYFAANSVRVEPDDEQLCEPGVALPPPPVKARAYELKTTTEPIAGPTFTVAGLVERWGMEEREVVEIMARANAVASTSEGARWRFSAGDVRLVEDSLEFRRRAAGM